MADRDAEERWELPITVPPVVEEIKALRVRCGLTEAEVRESSSRGSWNAFEANSDAQPIRQDNYAAAVADARRLAVTEERRRLLTAAVDDALAVESGEDGESHG